MGHGHHDLGGVELGRLQSQVIDTVLRESGDWDNVDIVTGSVNCLHWTKVFIKPETIKYFLLYKSEIETESINTTSNSVDLIR